MPRCTAAEIYRVLRLTNPSPYMFLFDTGQARILGTDAFEHLHAVQIGQSEIQQNRRGAGCNATAGSDG